MNIGKIDKPSQSGKQDAEFSGDGRSGVVATFLAQHGTAYHPKKGALMVSMPIEGNDGNSFGIAPESNTPTLAEGESAFGNFGVKTYFHFLASGHIDCYVKGVKVFTIDEEKIHGIIDVIMNGVSHINHTHPQNDGNDSGGGVNTGVPI